MELRRAILVRAVLLVPVLFKSWHSPMAWTAGSYCGFRGRTAGCPRQKKEEVGWEADTPHLMESNWGLLDDYFDKCSRTNLEIILWLASSQGELYLIKIRRDDLYDIRKQITCRMILNEGWMNEWMNDWQWQRVDDSVPVMIVGVNKRCYQ